MNRSAYFATGLVIKLLSRLTKASIVVHGKENIPTGPTIFVMNHFTRLETMLLPAYIYKLTGKPAWSLAASSLFRGGLGKFLDMMGAVSIADPKRDELIVKSLITGEANWIIFPEGNMVKTKKIVDGGKFLIASHNGVHEPHTGAAALALRAELFRTYLLDMADTAAEKLPKMLHALGVEGIDEICRAGIAIQPINLTYYPIRAAENIALDIASRLVKDIPEQMVEEIMTEGTMLLSGVDLDIRCGQPMQMADYLDTEWLHDDMARDGITGFSVSTSLKEKMRKTAYDVMQQYMQDIYAMTTVNHEHLFASFLRMYPFNRIEELDFRRRVFYGASLLRRAEEQKNSFFLHQALQENQAHLLTDDRYGKYDNFLELALDKGVVTLRGDYLIRHRSRLSAPLSFHKGRINNPIEIMANEVEPLKKFLAIIRALSWQPKFLLKILLVRHLLNQEKLQYAKDCRNCGQELDQEKTDHGRPFLLAGFRRRIGVLLVHSYLAAPAEVRELARYLRRQGYWVFAPRLPGHGTCAEDLAGRKYPQWVEAVDTGYVLLSTLCDRVVVGGVAVGGNLALDLAARVGKVTGVFALSPPFSLRNYSANFMPGKDVWNRILSRMKPGDHDQHFFEFTHGKSPVNYLKNPVTAVKEVGGYLESIEKKYAAISQPALILQANNNPIVDPRGTMQLYDGLGSVYKEFCLLSDDRHILVHGAGSGKVFRKIGEFIKDLTNKKTAV
ncbi:alpha/beta fold hydrolase [Desulfopila sp. IMCC35006]|uniref:alpha/beta fold hydrolase n=1 Tax=Desulfopila sp. IMCC35006 TaxID=2569542 RepID=UPI0010AD29F1|nr:alpha/beta fold hydrolase [Desulfopila sp. IMCC35006]TKB25028.1 alpha/beta fold hydrolase [Desulfopila sp. IMCC35006]